MSTPRQDGPQRPHEPEDPLVERLRALGLGAEPAAAPPGLARRVRRRRHVRRGAQAGGLVAVAAAATGVVLGGLPLPAHHGVPAAPPGTTASTAGPASPAPPAAAASCAAGDLAADPPTVAGPSVQTISVHRSADASGTCLLLPGSATTAQGRVLAAAGSRSVALAPGATVVLRLSWTGTCAAEPVQVTVGARGGPFLAASVALPTCGTVTLASTVDPAR